MIPITIGTAEHLADIPLPKSATICEPSPLARISYYLFPIPLRVAGWVDLKVYSWTVYGWPLQHAIGLQNTLYTTGRLTCDALPTVWLLSGALRSHTRRVQYSRPKLSFGTVDCQSTKWAKCRTRYVRSLQCMPSQRHHYMNVFRVTNMLKSNFSLKCQNLKKITDI